MTLRSQPLDGWPTWSLPRSTKRRAFLIGHLMDHWMTDDPEFRSPLLSQMDAHLTRPRDRELFGLDPLPSVCPAENKPGLRAVMHFQGPCFLELIPPPVEPDQDRWMYFFNIEAPADAYVDDPVAIMEATVAAAADLKRTARFGPGGGTLQKPALHYALYWGKADVPPERDMARCAAKSLYALGLEERQALILGHGDPAHPHVHVLVNRVHPETGRAADVRRYWAVLTDWATAYDHDDTTPPPPTTKHLHSRPPLPT